MTDDVGGTKVKGIHADPMEYEERAAELHDRTSLTRREAEVQALKEQGLGRAAIAEELEIAASTVDEYTRRIADRLRRARATLDELGGDRD